MLDTVVLKITHPLFTVGLPNFFSPALKIGDKSNFEYGRHKYKKYTQNTKLAGVYLPRLTVYERLDESFRLTYDLYIEFSIPKLLFGNSIQEYDETDFDKLLTQLKSRLAQMGIMVFESVLRKAIVAKAHFAKNIPLPSPMTIQDAISALYKADIGRGKDINVRHYENNGQALYFYASYANVIFYDKLKDAEASQGRALDKDKLREEKTLVSGLNKEQRPELLRYEIRLTKQQSLDAFLSRILEQKIKGIAFEAIFKKEIWKKALLLNWKEIIKSPASQLAFKLERPLEAVFDAMIAGLGANKRKKAHSLNTALASLGLYALINQYGVRPTRDKVEKNWTNKSWQRLSDKIKISATTLRGLPPSLAISEIQLALEKFERYDFKKD